MLAALGVIVPAGVLLLLVLDAADGSPLARATVDVDGRPVRFELWPQSDEVYACVSFDRDLIHYCRAVNKCVPGATHEAARGARFEYDSQQGRGQFLLDRAAVAFIHRNGAWHIEPWMLEIP